MKTKARQVTRRSVWIACDTNIHEGRYTICAVQAMRLMNSRPNDRVVCPLSGPVQHVTTWVRATLTFQARVEPERTCAPAPLVVQGGRAIDDA